MRDAPRVGRGRVRQQRAVRAKRQLRWRCVQDLRLHHMPSIPLQRATERLHEFAVRDKQRLRRKRQLHWVRMHNAPHIERGRVQQRGAVRARRRVHSGRVHAAACPPRRVLRFK